MLILPQTRMKWAVAQYNYQRLGVVVPRSATLQAYGKDPFQFTELLSLDEYGHVD
jgi:hypothetical protein